MIIKSSLGNRIIGFFTGLILVMACIAMAVMHLYMNGRASTQVASELAIGERIFARILGDKTQQLQQAAVVLAADFGFREAVMSKERATLISALENHGRRIHADLMMMVNLEGGLAASTALKSAPGDAFPYATLLAEARTQGQASGIVVTPDSLYQMVLVAVRAPVVIGWVAMGFRVDDSLARELGELTGLEISFVTHGAGIGWRMTGSSIPPPARAAALRPLEPLLGINPIRPTSPLVSAERVTTWSVLSASANATAVVVLQRSLADALHAADRLRWSMFALTLLGILAALAGSIAIARGITMPLRKLGTVAQSIADGDYTSMATVTADDEVGALASAFNQMREAIAARESTIMDLAYRDGLTQLPNRALLNDRLLQAIAAARRSGECASLLLLDLDDFQLVNSTLGHQHGDLVLQGVATRLQAVLTRKSDTLARLGGDEFAILLPATDIAAARRTAVRVLQTLEPPLLVAGHTVDVSGSIGVVTFPDHGEDVATLMSRVDISMTVAKRTRIGYAEYAPQYDQSPERLSLLSELRSAVETGQLVLVYQPKIEVATGHASQAEALLRWHHPERGFIPPDQFIPFAEQTGYIRAITHWVIDAACAQLARWRVNGVQLQISVNLSARDLLNNDLPQFVAATLARYAVEPALLWLEITESAIMDDPLRAQDNLHRLNALGLHLSIDDFGTGYSSLAYLKRLPVDEIKIDKTFVLNMDKDQDDAMIVRSTIDLAHNMGFKVVAEGVDHAETLAMLATWGCDIAQGYYICRPLAVPELERWLDERNRQSAARSPVAGSALCV